MATKALYRAFMHTARELERRKQPLLVQVPVLASRVQWYKPGAPQSQYVPTAPSLSETLRERMPRRARTTPDEQTGSQASIVLLLTCASLAVDRLPVAAGGRAAAGGCSEPRPAVGRAAPTHPAGLPHNEAFRQEVASPSAELDETASQQLDGVRVDTASQQLDGVRVDTASQQLDVAFSALRELHAQADTPSLSLSLSLTLTLTLTLTLALTLTRAGGAAALHHDPEP
eukprot:scaffold10380_cov57-Phaeocystis_antarctica.AAC.1